jgi:hypothetical protein
LCTIVVFSIKGSSTASCKHKVLIITTSSAGFTVSGENVSASAGEAIIMLCIMEPLCVRMRQFLFYLSFT